MEVNFEIKIENMNSCRVDGVKTVLWIFDWFGFCIKKSHQEAKFYIYHGQVEFREFLDFSPQGINSNSN